MSNINAISSQLRIIPPEVTSNQPPNTKLSQQLSPTNNARVGGDRDIKASSADKLAELTRGGLKVVTGYKPSIKSWISSKLFSVSNYLRGEQASFPATDRRGIITFRQLERLADDVIKTEPYKSGSQEAKGQYHQSLLNFQTALTSYIESKPVNSGFSDLLSSVDSELRSIHEAHDYAVIIPQPKPNTGEQLSSMAQVQPMPSVTTTAPNGVQPQVIPEGKQEDVWSMEGLFSNISNTDQSGSTNPTSHYGKAIPQPKPSVTTTAPNGVQPQVIPEGKQEQHESQIVRSSNYSTLSDLRSGEVKQGKQEVSAPDITSSQRMRFEKLSPDRAREVMIRANGDTKYLDILLAEAEKDSFETRSEAELIIAKRSRLTDDPAKGGLGIKPSELIVKDRLGSGNFGSVHVYERESDDPSQAIQFAGKVLTHGEEKELRREEAVLAKLPDHPNLVKSFGIHKIGDHKVLLQELVSGGSLDKVIAGLNWKALPTEKQLLVLKHVAIQVFRGLAELQKLGIAHEDVSARNLLFDKQTFDIKLADFGIAVPRGVEDTNKMHPVKWSAPEIISGNRRVSIVGDSFAASRLLVGELLEHVNLFNRETNKNSGHGLFGYTNAEVKEAANGGMPEQLHPDTVEALNKVDPTGNLADFFAQISNPNPTNRMRADKALQHPFLADPPTPKQLEDIFVGEQQATQPTNPPAPTGPYGFE